MSIVKKVGIDGKEVLFKASAAIPRIYRLKFQRDIYKDLRILEKSIGEGDEEHSNLDLFSLETRRFRTMWRNGWTGSIRFPFTRCCRS